MGLMHMEVDKVGAMVVNMEDDMVSDKAAARISRKCYFTILAKFHNHGRNSQSWQIFTIETFDQSGEEIWPYQQKHNKKNKDNDKYI